MSNISELLERELKHQPPRVNFERVAVENPTASREQGIAVCVDVDFVILSQPGGGGNNVKWKVTVARNWYKQEIQNGRMPMDWLDNFEKMYAMWKAGQELPVNGTPIRGWMLITPAQQKNLIAHNILTIEELANLNGEGVHRVGMGALELKNKAAMALQAAKDTGPLVLKNAAMEAELTLMKANYADMERKLAELMAEVRRDKPDAPAYEIPTIGISAADILEDDDAELADKYEKKFGEKPHHRMKRETIEKALRE